MFPISIKSDILKNFFFKMLKVTIVKAQDIPIGDVHTSDPYVKIYGITNTATFYFGKTKIAYITLNPHWNDVFYIPSVCANRLLFELHDYDFLSPDDYLGKVEISASSLYSETKDKVSKTFDIEKPYPISTTQIQPKIPTITIRISNVEYDLNQLPIYNKQKFDYLIAFHKSNSKNPILQVRELDPSNKEVVKHNNVLPNGQIITSHSISDSYIIKLNKLNQTMDRLQFYLSSYKGKVSSETTLVFLGLPKLTKETKTNDNIVAYVMDPQHYPFLFLECPMTSKILYNWDDSKKELIKQQITEEYETKYTMLEKQIYKIELNSSIDEILEAYQSLQTFTSEICSDTLSQNSIAHRDEVSHLCDVLLMKIYRHTHKDDLKDEMDNLLRAKILINPFSPTI